MKTWRWGVVLGVFWLAGILNAGEPGAGLANTTVLIIRHAEKPPAGRELTAKVRERGLNLCRGGHCTLPWCVETCAARVMSLLGSTRFQWD